MRIELLHITPNAEKVIEKAGRISYQSYDKQTELSYIQNMLSRKPLKI